MKLLRLAMPLLGAIPVFAQAMLVDSFTDGAVDLEILFPASPTVSSGPVDIEGSPFATREVSISYGIQRLEVDPVEGVLQYELQEPLAGQTGNPSGYFEITYAADTPVNMLQDGANAFRFMFDSATSGSSFPALLSVYAGDVRRSYRWTLGNISQEHPGAFAVDVLFDEFDGLDLTQVTRISIDASRIRPEVSFRLTSISTVPEPGTASLMLAFGLALYLSRRPRTKPFTGRWSLRSAHR